MKAQYFNLINGVQVPKLAFGTYRLADGPAGVQTIKDALAVGYRHFDTTYGYNNESIILQALSEFGLGREDIFITSKLWNADQGYDTTIAAFEKVCNNFNTDYLDLFLIRWPIPVGRSADYQALNQETWRAFEKLYAEKKVRAIGVCNFLVHHLLPLMQKSNIDPMVNQLEFNAFYQQRESVAYAQAHDILVASWSPVPQNLLDHPILIAMAAKYQTSVNQLCLAYCLDKNILPITHAQVKDQMERNANIFNLKLLEEDVQILDGLNTLTEYTFHPDRHEEWFA